MVEHPIVGREEWLRARAELLEREKRFTRERAELAAARRQLPWVRVDKRYELMGQDGPVSLAQAFRDRSQLAIYHIMFGPGWKAVCSGCTQWADAMNGTTATFGKLDANLIAVSSAPIDEIEVQRKKLGWTFTWLSAADSDFNLDFYGSAVEAGADVTGAVGIETVHFDRGENHGVNVFFRDDDGSIYHTYAAFNRGIEELNGAFGYYDLLPNGRGW